MGAQELLNKFMAMTFGEYKNMLNDRDNKIKEIKKLKKIIKLWETSWKKSESAHKTNIIIRMIKNLKSLK
jgi:hypothetical protein